MKEFISDALPVIGLLVIWSFGVSIATMMILSKIKQHDWRDDE